MAPNRRASAWLLALSLSMSSCAPVCAMAERADPIVATALDAGPPTPKLAISIAVLRLIVRLMCPAVPVQKQEEEK